MPNQRVNTWPSTSVAATSSRYSAARRRVHVARAQQRRSASGRGRSAGPEGNPPYRRGRAVLQILYSSLLLSGAMAMSAAAENAPGVTDSEIKIGQTMPYTGPGAWLSSIGLAEKAYMQNVDDGFLLWRTGMETRKLIEVERVAFMFGSLGTPTQLAVA